MFLGGPPLVKMATGEDADDEALGGADMHARMSGLADYFAADELDAIRHRPPDRAPGSTGASSGRRRGAATSRLRPRGAARHPPADLQVPFDPREVLARIVDGSAFDEFKPLYGTSAWSPAGPGCTAIRSGCSPTARRAVQRGGQEGDASSSSWPTRPTPRCSSCRTPPATWSAPSTSRAGSSSTARKMINAVSNSARAAPDDQHRRVLRRGQLRHVRARVRPALLVRLAGREVAVMGAEQLAGVLSIVGAAGGRGARAGRSTRKPTARRAPRSRSRSRRESTRSLSPRGSTTTASSTRATPAPCSASRLSAAHSHDVAGRRGFGVFRM